MATKSKLGTKRTCLECGKHFYDLNRNPVVCPNCKTEFEANKMYNSSRFGEMPTLEKIPVEKDIEAPDTTSFEEDVTEVTQQKSHNNSDDGDQVVQ